MHRPSRTHLTLVVVCLLTVALGAQRGGRGGGMRGGDDRSGLAPAAAVYDSAEYGFGFQAPMGLDLFTPEKPGRYGQILVDQRIIYLVSRQHREQTVVVRYSDKMTNADLAAYKAILESNPPQAKLPGFKKVALKSIRIGRQGDKTALDYVYNARQGDLPATVRQVVFIHNGRGFTFTCTASEPAFGEADTMLFNPLFSHLEFK